MGMKTTGRNDRPQRTLASISVYDNTGGVSISDSAIIVTLDTTRKNTDTDIFSLASDTITVALDGCYFISYEYSLDVTLGTGRSIGTGFLADGSSVEYDGWRSFSYHRTLLAGEDTAGRSGLVFAAAGDTFRIRADRRAGSDTLTTIADGSGMTIIRLGD